MTPWRIEIEGDDFNKFVRKLPAYEQAVLFAAIEQVLALSGPDICDSEWGRPLGSGLYEFRIRRSLNALTKSQPEFQPSAAGKRPVLLRIFCAFTENKLVLLLAGYDKGRDPSAARQQREIARARRLLMEWRNGQ